MLSQLVPLALLWALSLVVAGVRAQSENDFENSPAIKKVSMRAFSLAPPYLDSDMGNRWFDFGGNSIIRADRWIRLTSDRPSERGYLWSKVPLTASNWQLEIEFKIHGERNLFGDGLAMWLTTERATPGPVFGNQDQFTGLGFFFDTYKNGRAGTTFPLVMAMMGDGKATYDQAHDGKANELASCSARGLRGASVPTKARITYFQDKYLALDLQYKTENEWISCFTVHHDKGHSINIPPVAYLGFTAETGELHDNHEIISVKAYSLYNQRSNRGDHPSPIDDKHNTPGHQENANPKLDDHHIKKRGTWMGFFFKTFMFLGLLGGVYIAFTMYRASRRGRF